jgi:Carboxypeptidase regulatory-like domain
VKVFTSTPDYLSSGRLASVRRGDWHAAAYESSMRFAVLGMLLLFALGDGCSATPGVVGVQDYGLVTGRVLDAMTNKPISGALVSVGSLYTGSADAKGAFYLNTVPIGDQTVTARAPGYDTASADVTVFKNKTVDAGYVRLVPVIHPDGQPTLPPPPTPAPAAPAPAAGSSPAATGTPVPSPSPATAASPA